MTVSPVMCKINKWWWKYVATTNSVYRRSHPEHSKYRKTAHSAPLDLLGGGGWLSLLKNPHPHFRPFGPQPSALRASDDVAFPVTRHSENPGFTPRGRVGEMLGVSLPVQRTTWLSMWFLWWTLLLAWHIVSLSHEACVV